MAVRPFNLKPPSISTGGKHEMSMDEFKLWLKNFDADRDNRISKEELRQALHRVGGWFARWNGGRGVHSADANGNGFIDDNEIQNLVSFAENHLGVTIVVF